MARKRKKRKATEAEKEAGARNLAKWKEENPSGGRLTHGGYSRHFRQRYQDARTREGKQLRAIIRGLVEDLGGEASLSNAQRLILDGIKSKLIVIIQIAKYVDKQPSIINSQGELLPCLGKNYTTYAESLRRDLEVLFSVKRKSKTINLSEYINGKYGK